MSDELNPPALPTNRYQVNEIFYSVQGEGMRIGTANVFVRFTGCNMKCDVEPGDHSPGGFACDTEFASGVSMTLPDIYERCMNLLVAAGAAVPEGDFNYFNTASPWIILTGGEPALQVDVEFCDYFHRAGFHLAIETNGSIELPRKATAPPLPDWQTRPNANVNPLDLNDVLSTFLVDWITVSPKVAEHAIKQRFAHELKYVRGDGQGLPKSAVFAHHKLLSPATNGLTFDRGAVNTCAALVKANPNWRITAQLHKTWIVR